MATPSGLVPVLGPGGDIQWQAWTYDELLNHLANDLTPAATSLDFSALGVQPSALIPLTPINAWTVNASGPPPAMFKDAFNVVHLRGRMSTTGGVGTAPFAPLPAGYRPHKPGIDLYAAGGFNGTTATAAFLAVDGGAGNTGLYYAAGTTDIGLGGITWLAES